MPLRETPISHASSLRKKKRCHQRQGSNLLIVGLGQALRAAHVAADFVVRPVRVDARRIARTLSTATKSAPSSANGRQQKHRNRQRGKVTHTHSPWPSSPASCIPRTGRSLCTAPAPAPRCCSTGGSHRESIASEVVPSYKKRQQPDSQMKHGVSSRYQHTSLKTDRMESWINMVFLRGWCGIPGGSRLRASRRP